METTMTLISVVLVIWGILEIILFFKVWGMTNDVENIKKNISNENENKIYAGMLIGSLVQRVRRLYYSDKKEEAFEVLNKYLYYSLADIDNYFIHKDEAGKSYFRRDGGVVYVDEFVTKTLDSVRPLYEKIGREIPKQLANFNIDEFEDFGKTKKETENAQ